MTEITQTNRALSHDWRHKGRQLDAAGYKHLVPIPQGSKSPSYPNWQKVDFNSMGFDRNFGGYGVGVKCGETSGLDIDVLDEAVSRKLVNRAREIIGDAPIRIGQEPKALLVYRSSDAGRRKRQSTAYMPPEGTPDGKPYRCEALGDGQQFVTYGMHPNGRPYAHQGRELAAWPAPELNVLTDDHIDALFAYFDEIALAAGWKPAETQKPTRLKEPNLGQRQADHELTAPVPELEAAMSVIPIQPESYKRWIEIGMALYHATGGNKDGFRLWDAWSRRGDKYSPGETTSKWRSFAHPPATGALRGAKTIFYEADQADRQWRDRIDRSNNALAELGRKLCQLSEDCAGSGGVLVDPASDDDDHHRSTVQGNGPLNVVSLGSFDGYDIPERLWLVEGLIPGNNVSDLAGDGGTGKSLVALQLGVAVASGGKWLGRGVRQGRVLYVSCEDDTDELRRRVVPILRTEGLQMSEMSGLTIADLTNNAEGTELAEIAGGRLTMTGLYKALVEHVAEARPKLVIIDTRADVFAGNEIDRGQVRTFIRALRKLCFEYDLAILLLSHPSVGGMNMGTGQSGSTAWGNSVRSRLYLERAKATDGSVPNPDLRTLTVKKNNYGASDATIMLRWHGGLFVPDGLLSQMHVDHAEQDRIVEQEFLRLLDAFTLSGQRVSASTSPSYAPTQFERRSVADKGGPIGVVGKRQFAAAMDRLLAKGTIRHEEIGPPSRRYGKLVRVR